MSSAAIDIWKTDERCLYRRGVTQRHNISDIFSRNTIEIYFLLNKTCKNSRYILFVLCNNYNSICQRIINLN